MAREPGQVPAPRFGGGGGSGAPGVRGVVWVPGVNLGGGTQSLLWLVVSTLDEPKEIG